VTALLTPGGRDAVGVVLVGDELLLGSVADTNGAWLARTLSSQGLRLVETRVVPDDVDRVASAVSGLAGHVGSVVVSGGIGPTSDDLTREALAQACGCALVDDEAATAAITGWYEDRGRTPSAAVLRMARRPACAAMLVNPRGSAPGVRLPLGDCVVYAVPGVPCELMSMVHTVVLPDLLDRVGERHRVHSISVEVALLGESAVVGALAEVEAAVADEPAVDLAYLARPAQVSVRVSVREHDESRAAAHLAHWRARVRAALGEHVLGEDGATLPEVVVALLVEASATVACAESLTGGGVVAALTSVPGSSAVVRGGVAAYATDLKREVLGVPTELLARRGPVDPDVAVAMAQGARTTMDADWGLATTGVAGPDPVGDHPVGEVHVAVAGPDGTSVRSLMLAGDRDRVRALSTAHVLDALRLRLLGGNRSPDPRVVRMRS